MHIFISAERHRSLWLMDIAILTNGVDVRDVVEKVAFSNVNCYLLKEQKPFNILNIQKW